jgi:hypothetical protein
MIQLVPGNSKLVRIRVEDDDPATATHTPASSLALTLRVAPSATATTAIGTMEYTFTEYTAKPGTYWAVIPGADITDELATDYMHQPVALQFLDDAENINDYLDAVVKPSSRAR